MTNSASRFAVAALASLAFASPGVAQSGSQTVAGNTNIYQALGNTGPSGGEVGPIAIALTAGTNRVLTFSTVTGAWGCQNDPSYSADGLPTTGGICVGPANISSLNKLSGFVTPNHSMSLTGLFLGAGLPSVAPGSIDYSGGYGFASQTGILLGQMFYIGDGRTTDQAFGSTQSGTVQKFFVPDGATQLFLGIADACGFSGTPGCYDDNPGSMVATYSVSAQSVPVGTVPEPATYALMGVGLLAVGIAARRRKQA